VSVPHKPPEFDYYTIRQVLGEGGMGIVYLAYDRRTDLPVAIKVMSKKLFDPELQARFLKENQILASLNHRNIVRCYEITRARDGTPSIVMECLDGVDFRAFEGRPFPELLPLMIQALMGMSYLKSQNVIHRDLSSSNILVTLENRKRIVKIVDFGVAKILHQQATEGDFKTQTGQFLGKFAFASPELFVTTDIDWRSDVYSLGVIFHRLLTGRPPIEVARKASYFDWLMAHQKDHEFAVEAPPGVPPLPAAVVDIVRRMLARRPEDRPSSYEEIIEILDRAQGSLESGLEPDQETIATLPMPLPERISSSGGRASPLGATPSGARSLPVRPPTLARPTFAAAVPPPSPPAPPEPSGQEPAAGEAKRWRDLDGTAPTLAASGSASATPEPAKRPAVTPPPPFSKSVREEEPARAPETGPYPLPPPTVRPPPLAPPPVWAGGAVAGDTSPRETDLPPSGVSDKTERIDDVVARLKLHAAAASASARPVSVAPPAPPVPLAEPDLKRTPPRPAAETPPAPRRIVVYGGPPAAGPRRPLPAPPPPPPTPQKGANSRDKSIRTVGIALIVAAIVILFASVLWFLISLARGPARSALPAAPGTRLALFSDETSGPPNLATPQLTKERS
jgi:serine/threonine protein kinase